MRFFDWLVAAILILLLISAWLEDSDFQRLERLEREVSKLQTYYADRD